MTEQFWHIVRSVYNLILDVKSVTSEDGKYLNNTIDALVKCFGLDKDNIKK